MSVSLSITILLNKINKWVYFFFNRSMILCISFWFYFKVILSVYFTHTNIHINISLVLECFLWSFYPKYHLNLIEWKSLNLLQMRANLTQTFDKTHSYSDKSPQVHVYNVYCQDLVNILSSSTFTLLSTWEYIDFFPPLYCPRRTS